MCQLRVWRFHGHVLTARQPRDKGPSVMNRIRQLSEWRKRSGRVRSLPHCDLGSVSLRRLFLLDDQIHPGSRIEFVKLCDQTSLRTPPMRHSRNGCNISRSIPHSRKLVNEADVRMCSLDGWNHVTLVLGWWPLTCATAPGAFEDLVQQKHSHVTTDAITPSRNTGDGFNHCFSKSGLKRIELQNIWPCRKVGARPQAQTVPSTS